ncbi:MAG TPA: hypothetical protein VIE15_02945 [Acidimicrobiales bacterium]
MRVRDGAGRFGRFAAGRLALDLAAAARFGRAGALLRDVGRDVAFFAGREEDFALDAGRFFAVLDFLGVVWRFGRLEAPDRAGVIASS